VILSRYLTREIVNTLVAIMAILLLALLSQQIVRYLNYVAIGKIPTGILLQLVGFEVPYLLALLLPLGLYLGLLLTYGRLYADNEMIIMQMSGFGLKRILRLTTIIAMIAMGLVLYLMLWVNPWIAEKRERLMSSDEATLHLIQTLMPGRFQASPDGKRVLYVEKLSRDHQRAENVFIAEEKKATTDTGKNWSLILANQGYQTKDKDSEDPFFVTIDGYRYEGVPGQNDYRITKFKKYAVRIPEPIHTTHQASETLTTQQLWDNYDNLKHAAELQWRFSICLSTFLLALLAVPLSILRPRQGRYLILLPAVLIYIVYIELLIIARHWVEQGELSLTIGMWWVHGLMLLLIAGAILFNSRLKV